MPVQHAPAVAVPVDHQLALVANFLDAGKSHTVEADHRAGAALLHNSFIAAQHCIHLPAEVEGVHHFFTGLVGVFVDYFHHRIHAILEPGIGGRTHQLVIFNKIDAGIHQRIHQVGSLLGRHSHAGFYNRANQRSFLHLCGLATSLNPKIWSRKVIGKGIGQLQVHKL